MAKDIRKDLNSKSSTAKTEKTWAMFCHLSSFIGFVIPFGNILAPLILWLLKKEEFPLVDDQGKESLNFQISMTIYLLGAVILSFILIGIPLLLGLLVLSVVLVIKAAINTSNGESYRYPLSIKFVK